MVLVDNLLMTQYQGPFVRDTWKFKRRNTDNNSAASCNGLSVIMDRSDRHSLTTPGQTQSHCSRLEIYKCDASYLQSLSLLVLLIASLLPGGMTTAVPTHSNITSILNNLLLGYDSRLRPGYGGHPTTIHADMNIRSMGPISEVDMAYSMDAYFRQTWVDRRLQFKGPIDEMAVHIKMLDLIWKPDTYFYNGKGSYLHTITTPNKLLRIKQDGTVLYSMRLTIKANCPMYLQYFPVDEQLCPLQFGSYAYTKDQLLYIWKHGEKRSIKTSKDMRLSQFDLIGHPASNRTVKNRSGYFSTLRVKFRLQRHMGYFLIQVYVPCTLLVILSWVSFWINREATADRISLGVTTVLTLTTLSMDTRDQLPKVPYATALDWFVIMCFAYVTGTLLEFAGVHYFTKIGSGEIQHDSDSEEEGADEKLLQIHQGNIRESLYNQTSMFSPITNHVNHIPSQSSHIIPPDLRPKKDGCLKKFLRCLQGNSKYRKLMIRRAHKTSWNSVSIIDRVSRYLFPLSFTILNVMYWIAYTRTSSEHELDAW